MLLLSSLTLYRLVIVLDLSIFKYHVSFLWVRSLYRIAVFHILSDRSQISFKRLMINRLALRTKFMSHHSEQIKYVDSIIYECTLTHFNAIKKREQNKMYYVIFMNKQLSTFVCVKLCFKKNIEKL